MNDQNVMVFEPDDSKEPDGVAEYTSLEHYLARPRDRRNGPCHCGSGKKFKKCCMRAKDQAVEGKQNAD